MTIDAKLEIRKLPPSHISQLSSILEFADQWKKLMSIVPSVLTKDNFECNISCDNLAKYNSEHIRLIEAASVKYKRTGTEILLDEWGCSGRIRPAVGHLLHLLIQAELFRAADYVAEKILHGSPPKRPSQGPAAPISTNLHGYIMEGRLDEMDYPSSLLENLRFTSFNNNLNYSEKRSSIPQIVVTPDVDVASSSPDFNMHIESTNEANETQEVSSMIQFSSSSLESEPITSSVPNLSNFSNSDTIYDSETTTVTDSGSCELSSNRMPALSDLLLTETQLPNITELNCETEENEDDIPNISMLNQKSENDIAKITNVNQYSEGNLPNLTGLVQSFTQSSSDNGNNIPNLSELNQSAAEIPNFGELISITIPSNAETISDISSSSAVPDINILTSSSRAHKSENTEEDDSLPNLSVLIPETTRRLSLNVSTNTMNSSTKSRQCTSPLPNLTLNTHLPHFAYHELEMATNNFNEEIFESLDRSGRFLGSGAFGKVFLAVGLFDKPVAVKKILLDNVEVVNVDDTVTKQFRNEVEVLSRFKHDNLLSLLGYSCDGCTYCLLYEYISGGTLKDRLQNSNQKLMWQERLIIALGTAKAISYLHTAFSSPLIHRDIKTANILLDCSNKPKLGDFGITKLLNNQNTNTCTVIGTSAYMAPEALRGDISVKCDTFSFGVVLLELLTSLPTFDENRDGNDLVTHVEENCEESIQPLLDISVGDWKSDGIDFSEQLYAIATQCLEEKKKRPVMVDVTNMLIEIVVERVAISSKQ